MAVGKNLIGAYFYPKNGAEQGFYVSGKMHTRQKSDSFITAQKNLNQLASGILLSSISLERINQYLSKSRSFHGDNYWGRITSEATTFSRVWLFVSII